MAFHDVARPAGPAATTRTGKGVTMRSYPSNPTDLPSPQGMSSERRAVARRVPGVPGIAGQHGA
ncbi:hypothetical protein IU436_07155 [Nocardia farcinica]|uniref:hypothetical protein n=1 Tax=Nocardia TaxID=1817 RepID=UPI000BF06790|nr:MULTISPECIES: hypothetical protein [Nocardia]MBF6184460.1 hypothetical protein [Nocardia farcinica]MBF6310304.1 hypothetical protein [Nocardia farcinica]MBF6405876.1 hypothetical protein [Nocardia farcinica]MBF6418646.1 hypothetical protein [Nocardia farcinica]MBF6430123.1 hypothetical protein [Nocardia farcinica]